MLYHLVSNLSDAVVLTEDVARLSALNSYEELLVLSLLLTLLNNSLVLEDLDDLVLV
jgi:hypothetical protein